MAGYFDPEFKILPGSYIDPISLRRKARLEEKKKNIVTKPFVSMYRARDPYVIDLLAFTHEDRICTLIITDRFCTHHTIDHTMHNVRPGDIHTTQTTWRFLFSSEGLGSFFGTIGGAVKDTDPTKAKYRERVKPPTEKPNVKANPPKKGSGYGYSSSIARLSFHLSHSD